MGLDAFDPQDFLVRVWLSSGSSRSWILQTLPEPCAWSLEMTRPSKDLGLLVDAHALAAPSSTFGANVFSDGEDPGTPRPPDP